MKKGVFKRGKTPLFNLIPPLLRKERGIKSFSGRIKG